MSAKISAAAGSSISVNTSSGGGGGALIATPAANTGTSSSAVTTVAAADSTTSTTTTTAAATATATVTTNISSTVATAANSSSAASQNGSATPARRLRTRNSTGGGSGNGSGGESAKKTGSADGGNTNSASSTPLSSGVGGSGSNSSASGGNEGSASKRYHNVCVPQTPLSCLPNAPVGSGASSTTTSTVGCTLGRKGQLHTQPHSSSTFNLNKNEEFHFDTPPECSVFRPTPEEFKNPLAYISKIRPIAEKCGIAKILPPESWAPPFAVDVDKLKFTPRVQRLNELEAKTRVKLNFLDQIAKFWELQGSSLKIPMVERKALDLYTLHRIVQEEGGMEQTTRERKWAKVATRMCYPSSKSVGATLKAHYERILNPFEVYTSGKVLSSGTSSSGGDSGVKLEDGTDYKAHEIPTRQQITPPNENNARRSKRFANSKANCGLGGATRGGGASGIFKLESKEDIKRDLFNTGSGGNGAGIIRSTGNGGGGSCNATPKKAPDPGLIDPLMKYICHICNRGDVEESMLLCDGCDDSYHTFCLLPPLSTIPKGEWLCPRCVVEEVSKPTEAFGFEQAEREYTLQQFGQMADQFKSDYFRKPVHQVPTDLVEREFWRIVSSIDEDVTVEYGADLHTMDHGSGFPTKSSLYLLPGDQEYAESSWNLNNLPLLEDSILGHINADISGMNAPWMYVGMCFAAFCWHNEDHWSYSINYLHWGEPKTWYGVPGNCAEQFEETMKQAAPELFASQPDLLHQLVTIMNPNILMNNGVPVYRTDQNAGEFVITFPRAYHAGFNQGYNFAEAVNFAPADWLKMGRECVNHYSMLRRFCVFSHDELVCKMALEPAKLTFGIATACYIDMAEMVDSEKKLRKSLLEWGVTRAERKAFELIPDDERHCQECNTTCFLSAVACECTKSIVCLRHYTVLCICSPERHTLLYRYTLDEMPLMLHKLKTKAQSFERWLTRCRDIADANTPTSVTLAELQELCKEAELKKFPSSLLIDRLNAAVLEAEKCVTVIQQLGINKVRTRSDNSVETAQYKLTMEELELFVQEIDNLCCIIEEGASVRELLVLGKQFVERANAMLAQPLEKLEEPIVEALIAEGNSLRIELHQLHQLAVRLKQVRWYKRAQGKRLSSMTKITYTDIQELLEIAAAELLVPSDKLIEREIHKLQEIGAAIELWEREAACYFRGGTQQHELANIEQLLRKGNEMEGQMPSAATLRDALRRVRDWLQTVKQLQADGHSPYCHTLEAIVQCGRNIPIQLEELTRMQGHLNSAHDWKESTAHTFLKKQTYYTLLEVLMPRAAPVIIDSDLKQPFRDDFVRELNPARILDTFKVAGEKELRDMRELRRQNMAKHPLRDDYCLCKRNFHGIMYNCQLCRDWFHEDCVPLPPAPLATQLSSHSIGPKPKWLCPSCVRSKRPRLETILPLLVSLQRLPIRLPEDEALRCLAERAMNWQDRARKALTSPDVTAALEAIATAQQRKQKRKNAGSGRKTRRSSHRNSKEDAPAADLAHATTNRSDIDDDDYDDDDEGRLHIVEEDGYSNDGLQTSAAVLTAAAEDAQHADDIAVELQKLLSDSETENLDELMMEGDLLEVSLDESLELWRVLAMVRPPNASEAAALVEQQLQQKQQQQQQQPRNQSNSELNSAAEDSNDSLLVQSSPNSNSGSGGVGASGRNSSNKKRRSLDNNTGCTVPRKKSYNTSTTSTNSHKTSGGFAAAKKSTRKSDPTSITNDPAADLYAFTKQLNGGSSMSGVFVVHAGNAQKKRKRMTNNAHNNSSGSSSSGANHNNAGTGNNSAHAGSSNTGASGSAGGQKKHSNRGAQLAQQEDDEEECRAENCHKPTGREVDWVQCDGGCNEWFHMYCVGLNRSQIKADDDYICIRCSKSMTMTVAVAAGGAASSRASPAANSSSTHTVIATAATTQHASAASNNNATTISSDVTTTAAVTASTATTTATTTSLNKGGRTQAAR